MEINIYPLDENLGGELMKFAIREARVNLPEWYKTSQSYLFDPKTPQARDKSMTMKKCTPILDYLSTGLNLHTPSAIYVEGNYPNRKISSASQDPALSISSHHTDQRQNLPVSKEYDQTPYKIEFPYSIETPKGFSTLFVAYNEDEDFPLIFPSAIVQTDKYRAPVNFPFFMKKSFEGKIDAGTPFMKAIFVKRDDFSIKYREAQEGRSTMMQHKSMVQAFGSGFYKKLRLDKI
jgi:hypothetical protein